MLWAIAAVAGSVMLSGIAFLVLRRDDPAEDEFTRPRHSQPWDERPGESGDSKPPSIPPPSGVPMHPTVSEELSVLLESQELWLGDDDEPTGPVPKILVSSAAGTHTGLKRDHNEDAYLMLAEHEIYAVADGMGGYAAGEVASKIAIDTVEAFFEGEMPEVEPGLPRRGAELAAAVKKANRLVRAAASEDTSKAGMGTTIVSARFSPGRRRVYIIHVGDSRCYRVREGEITQLTADHTLAAVGIKGPAGAKLSRAVGVFDDVDVDLTIDEPLPGDFYMLCSDGLYRMVPDDEMLRIVERGETLGETIEALIDAANEKGGRDNISVVLLGIDEPSFDPGESGEHRLPG